MTRMVPLLERLMRIQGGFREHLHIGRVDCERAHLIILIFQSRGDGKLSEQLQNRLRRESGAVDLFSTVFPHFNSKPTSNQALDDRKTYRPGGR